MDRYTIDGRVDELETLVESAQTSISQLQLQLDEAEMRVLGWKQKAEEAVRQRNAETAKAARAFEAIGRAEIDRLDRQMEIAARKEIREPVHSAESTGCKAHEIISTVFTLAVYGTIGILTLMVMINTIHMIYLISMGAK